MQLLQDKIRLEGKVVDDALLKVDSFLNHQIDPILMMALGEEFGKRFANCGITKVLTVETSGIAVALPTALALKVPAVFARKKKSAVTEAVYATNVYSFTKKETNTITVSKDFLTAHDKVLIIDDFLANGAAVMGLANLVEQAGGQVVGIGIVIEKHFQPGYAKISQAGYRLESLVRIGSFSNGQVNFV